MQETQDPQVTHSDREVALGKSTIGASDFQIQTNNIAAREDRLQKIMISKMGKKVRISRAKDNVTMKGSDQRISRWFQRQ
jgi:hypothetical protein